MKNLEIGQTCRKDKNVLLKKDEWLYAGISPETNKPFLVCSHDQADEPQKHNPNSVCAVVGWKGQRRLPTEKEAILLKNLQDARLLPEFKKNAGYWIDGSKKIGEKVKAQRSFLFETGEALWSRTTNTDGWPTQAKKLERHVMDWNI